MHQGDLALFVVVQQRQATQPVEQWLAVRRLEDFPQRVGLLQALGLVRHRQQVQVVVAQNADHRLAHGIEEAQRLQGLRAAVDQVADQPQAVLGRVEGDALQQAFQGIQATLQVAYRVDRHQCSAPGTARRNTGIAASKAIPSLPSIW